MQSTLIYGRMGRKSKEGLPMPFVAASVNLPDEIRPVLSKYARSRTLPARQVQRAKIILLAADGHNNMQISKQVGLGQDSVSKWRTRFLKALPMLQEVAEKILINWRIWWESFLMTIRVRDSLRITRMNKSSKYSKLLAAARKSLDTRPATGVRICLWLLL